MKAASVGVGEPAQAHSLPIKELLAHVGRESLLRSRAFVIAGNVSVRYATGGAVAAVVPPRIVPCGARARTWVLCIRDRMQLLERPRRLSEHSVADPGAQQWVEWHPVARETRRQRAPT